jgi:hypothetical protein
MSTLCAPFSLKRLTCDLEATKDGSGWMYWGSDIPENAAICFQPEIGDESTPTKDRPFKKVWLLYANGTTGELKPGPLATDRIIAIKFIPNRPLTLIYFGANGSCKPEAPT